MLSKTLKAYRLQEKLSVGEFAKIIGISHSVLWHFERRDREISGDSWVKILDLAPDFGIITKHATNEDQIPNNHLGGRSSESCRV